MTRPVETAEGTLSSLYAKKLRYTDTVCILSLYNGQHLSGPEENFQRFRERSHEKLLQKCKENLWKKTQKKNILEVIMGLNSKKTGINPVTNSNNYFRNNSKRDPGRAVGYLEKIRGKPEEKSRRKL